MGGRGFPYFCFSTFITFLNPRWFFLSLSLDRRRESLFFLSGILSDTVGRDFLCADLGNASWTDEGLGNGAVQPDSFRFFCTLLFCRQPAHVSCISCDCTDFSSLSLLRRYGADTSACVPGVHSKRAGKWRLRFPLISWYNPIFDSWLRRNRCTPQVLSGVQRFCSLSRTLVIYDLPLLSFWMVRIWLLVINW